jgi:hypothetical protein
MLWQQMVILKHHADISSIPRHTPRTKFADVYLVNIDAAPSRHICTNEQP